MGQTVSAQSTDPRSHEELTRALAQKFTDKCFTQLEFYSLRDVFKNLADKEHDVKYLKEDTIARFLEIPDILHASPVVFQMVSYIGAFPFLREAPAVLGLEQIIIVVTILTDRYRRVLARGAADQRKLIFKSLAVYDRKLSEMDVDNTSEDKGSQASGVTLQGEEVQKDVSSHLPGFHFAVDEAGDEGEDDDEEDLAFETDELVLAAFQSIDYVDVFKYGNAPTIRGAMVPADNFRKLIMLLLLVAPLGPQESLSAYSSRIVGAELDSLRTTAESILASFLNVETAPGIKFHMFDSIVPGCFPHLFNGFSALFEHFLFSKSMDLNKHKQRDGQSSALVIPPPALVPQPLLQDNPQASIMNPNVLSQLSFFIPGEALFRRLRLLFWGDNDGFSMCNFENKVFNWRAPTILLVRGHRLQDDPNPNRKVETAFTASLPTKRFPHGSKRRNSAGDSTEPDVLTFGVYLGQPWKHSHRECFGDEDTLLFQLEPVHDVFRASRVNRDYASFNKPTSSNSGPTGLAFGCPLPTGSSSRRSERSVTLGPLSLYIDDGLEFGCFTHDYTSRGGAFQTSVVRKFDFQDRFEVESLEVWGCGGDEEAKTQAERWAWEHKEAEARRRINLGTGDVESDRALLEMAGLVGANRSGGSMG